jgi:undecaprenyl phosphate N,N'-diacetylbacillosamine 1-phosphate transferase
MMYRSFFKRFLDIVLSIFALVMLLPVILPLMVFLLVAHRGKVFYIQKRPGKHETVFNLIKFRSMNDRKDTNGNLLPDSERMTRAGTFIRKASLDEIPQLINILKGDMSLVGPRPLLVDYLPLYNDVQKRRHDVKPGITGWAQVNGRNEISWEEKFRLDVWYVNNLTFLLDLKILWLTIVKVIKSEGISQRGKTTAEPFKGNIQGI